MNRSSLSRLSAASILAYLSFAGTPANAHGLTPELVFLLLGALLVHIGAPIALLGMRRFEGRRGQVFGAYAAIMTLYYVLMWMGEYAAMFLFPVFPVLLVAIFYMAVHHTWDQS